MLNFQDSILNIQDIKSYIQLNTLNFQDSISKIQDNKIKYKDKLALSGFRTIGTAWSVKVLYRDIVFTQEMKVDWISRHENHL